MDFEDLFAQFGGGKTTGNTGFPEFDFGDLFGSKRKKTTGKTQESPKNPEPQTLDIEKTYEVPIFDVILGCKIEVKGENNQKAKMTIPPLTKPGTKMRVKNFGKKDGSKTGHLIVTIDVRMPKHISDVDRKLLENIAENI